MCIVKARWQTAPVPKQKCHVSFCVPVFYHKWNLKGNTIVKETNKRPEKAFDLLYSLHHFLYTNATGYGAVDNSYTKLSCGWIKHFLCIGLPLRVAGSAVYYDLDVMFIVSRGNATGFSHVTMSSDLPCVLGKAGVPFSAPGKEQITFCVPDFPWASLLHS